VNVKYVKVSDTGIMIVNIFCCIASTASCVLNLVTVWKVDNILLFKIAVYFQIGIFAVWSSMEVFGLSRIIDSMLF
jgi:hypothetical protein